MLHSNHYQNLHASLSSKMIYVEFDISGGGAFIEKEVYSQFQLRGEGHIGEGAS